MAKVIPIPIGPIFSDGSCRGLVHVIQKGDTLYELGKRYHVSVTQLMFANPFVDVYNLQVGDELCIPAVIQPRQVESLPQGGQAQMPAGRSQGRPLPEAADGAMDSRRAGTKMAPAVREEPAVPDRMVEEGMPEPMPFGQMGEERMPEPMPFGQMVEEGMPEPTPSGQMVEEGMPEPVPSGQMGEMGQD